MSTDPRVAEAMKLASELHSSDLLALRYYLQTQFSNLEDALVMVRNSADHRQAEIARLTASLAERENTVDRLETEVARLNAELADEKAVNEHQRSELQDRLQKQRSAEAGLSQARGALHKIGHAVGMIAGSDVVAGSPPAVAKLLAELEEARKDAGRLDHLQNSGSTIELVAGGHEGNELRFRVGGLHRTVHRDVRAAIDAAMTKEKP